MYHLKQSHNSVDKIWSFKSINEKSLQYPSVISNQVDEDLHQILSFELCLWCDISNCLNEKPFLYVLQNLMYEVFQFMSLVFEKHN